MTFKTFIAELHDIGKLVDREALKQAGICIAGHTVSDFDFSQLGISTPSSPSWWGQYSAEVKSLTSSIELKDYTSDVLLTNIADELAASISRTWGKKGGVVEGLHVLWNPDFYKKEVKDGKRGSAFTTPDELRMMFQFIDNCNSPDEFFDTYRDNLRLTAEDKSAPLNIIDLLTHLKLTGKIYRVLKKHSEFDQQRNKLIYNDNEVQQIKEATGGRIDKPNQRGEWIYRLIFCHISFSQSLVRLQDLNVFKKRANLIKAFLEDEKTKDYVLFFTDDFMCLFIPKEDEVKVQELLQPFLEGGFIIDCRYEMEAELNLLTSSMERARDKFKSQQTTRHLKLYERRENSDLRKVLKPPLCESCQMRQGNKEWHKDQIHESLCDICYEIRKIGNPACGYAEWDEKGLKAAWMKITLGQNQLLKTVEKLFEEYVDTSQLMQSVNANDKTSLKESFRPLAVQMSFVDDYKMFLQAFKEKIYGIKSNDGNLFFTEESFLYPIDEYNEFGIFKVHSGEAVLKVLDLFYNILEKYFPKCLNDSPIKLSLSLAQVKYPYQEHWRFLSEPENTINIQSPGSTRLNISIAQYKALKEKIIKEETRLSHFLHRLANIETKTKSNVTVMREILENRKNFPALLELTKNGLLVRQILNFHKLTCEETPNERIS